MNKEQENLMINKLSKLTCIEESIFKYLQNLVWSVVNDSISETINCTEKEYCDVDVGIGVITYRILNRTAEFYKFEPYRKFNTFKTDSKFESELDLKVKNKLVDALTNRYKEYL